MAALGGGAVSCERGTPAAARNHPCGMRLCHVKMFLSVLDAVTDRKNTLDFEGGRSVVLTVFFGWKMFIRRLQVVHRVSSSLLEPVVPSF